MTNVYISETFINGIDFKAPLILVLIFILILWSIVWKGLALWRSAKRGEKVWFIIFLVINTAGILEIIYLIITHESKGSVINPQAPRQFTPPTNPNLP